MLLKVLITGVWCSLNYGEMAIVLSVTENLKRIIRDVQFTIFSSHFSDDFRRYRGYDVRIEPRFSSNSTILQILELLIDPLLCLFLFFLNKIFVFKGLKLNILNPAYAYLSSDIIIDLGADNFSDVYGVKSTVVSFFNILPAILLKKPIILLGESIGPFNYFFTRLIAKFVLNNVDLIVVRESVSLDYLKSIGVKKRIFLTADPAFLLKPTSNVKVEEILLKERVPGGYPLVGVNINPYVLKKAFPGIKEINRKYEEYVKVMAEILDYLTEKFGFKVLFVPHIIGPGEANDERVIAEKVYSNVKNKDNVFLIRGEYLPSDIKGVIGRCELFISSRLHPLIAATSTNVPSIGLAYSHKYHGVIGRTLGFDYIIDLRKHNPDELLLLLKQKIDFLWNNREKIRRELSENIPKIKEYALTNFKLVKKFVELRDKRTKFDNVKDIWSEGLCTGCGACSAACKNNAIEMKKTSSGLYAPKLDASICKECGLCIKICPGHLVEFDELNKLVFNKTPEDTLLGNFLRCYVGHATNFETRWRGASGGLVSALLVFALQEKIIDGALVTRMNKEKPLEPEAIIAKSAHEILEAAGSKYCPSPTGTAIKEILNVDGKYAFVGLPCHIHAIRKMEKNNKKLKNRIVLHLGLLCLYSPTFTGTNVLLKKMGVSKNEVDKLSYRGEGWPGNVVIKMRNGGEKRLPSTEARSILFSGFFIPWRCTMCCDGTSELADLSFGDAWLRETSGDKIGSSLIISRNEIGENLLQVAKSKGIIRIQEISRDKVLKACGRIITFKKKQIMARFKLLNLIGKKHPEYHTKIPKPSILSYFKGTIQYACINMTNNRFVSNFLKYAPFRILKWFTMFTQTFI